MFRPVLLAAAVLPFASNVKLSTDYGSERGLRIETNSTMKFETTHMEMTRDGEPVDRPGGGGDATVESTRKIVQIDHWKAHDGGKLTKVERTFEDIDAKTTVNFGGDSRDMAQDSPLKGVTLSLEKNEKGEVEAKVVSGDKPKQDEALEGHQLELDLDALLPGDDRAAKASWDLEDAAIKRAFGMNIQKAMFPPSDAKDDTGGGGGGGGRGGRRGGMRGGPGGQSGRLLEIAEFSGKATLSSEEEEKDGVKCAVIDLVINAKGDMPEPKFNGPRRGEREFDPLAIAPYVFFASTYSIKLEGKLWFDRTAKHPMALEMEGSARIETDSDRDFGQSKMHIKSTQEGELKYTVGIKKAE